MLTLFTSDLQPGESKINRANVLTKTNHHVKYDSSVINSSQANEWKPYLFYKKDPCDLDL